jgi:hypothetical protein
MRNVVNLGCKSSSSSRFRGDWSSVLTGNLQTRQCRVPHRLLRTSRRSWPHTSLPGQNFVGDTNNPTNWIAGTALNFSSNLSADSFDSTRTTMYLAMLPPFGRGDDAPIIACAADRRQLPTGMTECWKADCQPALTNACGGIRVVLQSPPQPRGTDRGHHNEWGPEQENHHGCCQGKDRQG